MFHELFKDFVEKFNIRNGEIASQQNLNESVNVLKKETDDLYNRLQIIKGENGLSWNSQTKYVAGEIVFYNTKHWIVKENEESINEYPDYYTNKWQITTISDWINTKLAVDENLSEYIKFNNDKEYEPTDEYNPTTKLYTDNVHKGYSVGKNINLGINFLPIDDSKIEHIIGNGLAENHNDYIPPYKPTEDTHPATKEYVDAQINEYVESASSNANTLGLRDASQYITLDENEDGINGFAIKNGDSADSISTSEWIRVTSAGLLPYDQKAGSSLGSTKWKFNEVHTKNVYSDKILSKNTNIAEKYESDIEYEAGTVLGFGGVTEVVKFEQGMVPAGIVSENPGFLLNSEIEGVYIVLKGRVFCNIEGVANRGDYINASKEGKCISSKNKTELTLGICITPSSNGKVEVKV